MKTKHYNSKPDNLPWRKITKIFTKIFTFFVIVSALDKQQYKAKANYVANTDYYINENRKKQERCKEWQWGKEILCSVQCCWETFFQWTSMSQKSRRPELFTQWCIHFNVFKCILTGFDLKLLLDMVAGTWYTNILYVRIQCYENKAYVANFAIWDQNYKH